MGNEGEITISEGSAMGNCPACGVPWTKHLGVQGTCNKWWAEHVDRLRAMDALKAVVNHHAGRSDGTLDWHGEPKYLGTLEALGLVEVTERAKDRTKGKWR